MEAQGVYESVPRRDGLGLGKRSQDQTEAQNNKRRRCVEPITLCLGIFCALLLAALIVMYIHLTAEREMMEINKYICWHHDSLQENNEKLETRVQHLSDALMKSISGTFTYFISNEMKNWTESRRFCRDRGADLIIVNTEEEQRYISLLVNENVWIGLSDMENEGNMTWVDNTTLNIRFWDGNEPNDRDGKKDCVEMMTFSTFGILNWNNLSCSDARKWICEN